MVTLLASVRAAVATAPLGTSSPFLPTVPVADIDRLRGGRMADRRLYNGEPDDP